MLWPDTETTGIGLHKGFALAQIVKIREDELEFLNAIKDLDGARQSLWHDDLKLMVITTGSLGYMFFTPTLNAKFESLSVDVIDSTGARFVAGLLQRILNDPTTPGDYQKLLTLCRFANALAALTTGKSGAIPALPDCERVNHFLNAQPTIPDPLT